MYRIIAEILDEPDSYLGKLSIRAESLVACHSDDVEESINPVG